MYNSKCFASLHVLKMLELMILLELGRVSYILNNKADQELETVTMCLFVPILGIQILWLQIQFTNHHGT